MIFYYEYFKIENSYFSKCSILRDFQMYYFFYLTDPKLFNDKSDKIQNFAQL